MQHTDLCAELETAFTPALLEALAGRFGLAPDLLRHVIGQAAPVLVAALMAAAVTREGTARLFAVATSAQANARLPRYLPQLVATTAGLKALENAGQGLLERSTPVSLAALSDWVAARTGVPSQATYALTGLCAAVLLGALKRDLLIEQATQATLPARLAGQGPSVAPHLDDVLARALGGEDAREFTDTVAARLRVLAAALRRAGEALPPAATTATTTTTVATPAEVATPDLVSQRRGVRRQMWRSVGLLVVLMIGALGYIEWRHGPASVATLAHCAAGAAQVLVPGWGRVDGVSRP